MKQIRNADDKSSCSLRSIETKILQTRQEADALTTAFIEAKSNLLRANIEKKMTEYEVLINDLMLQKAKIELERRLKVTKKDILNFVAELIQGDPNDKEFQKRIIDNLISLVYVYDSMIA